MELLCPVGRLLKVGIWLLAIGFLLGFSLGFGTAIAAPDTTAALDATAAPGLTAALDTAAAPPSIAAPAD